MTDWLIKSIAPFVQISDYQNCVLVNQQYRQIFQPLIYQHYWVLLDHWKLGFTQIKVPSNWRQVIELPNIRRFKVIDFLMPNFRLRPAPQIRNMNNYYRPKRRSSRPRRRSIYWKSTINDD